MKRTITITTINPEKYLAVRAAVAEVAEVCEISGVSQQQGIFKARVEVRNVEHYADVMAKVDRISGVQRWYATRGSNDRDLKGLRAIDYLEQKHGIRSQTGWVSGEHFARTGRSHYQT